MAIEKNKTSSKSISKTEIRKKKKRMQLIIGIGIGILILVAAVLFIINRINQNRATPISITTYHAEAIGYGDVDTTISGSGTLSPMKQESLSLKDDYLNAIADESSDESTEGAENDGTEAQDNDSGIGSIPGDMMPVSYTVKDLHCTAGERLSEGDVILSLTDENEKEYEYKAPYDCVILTMTLSEGDTIVTDGTVASVMGTEGFTMSIAVDEYDIATVEIGQEVTFTVNALGEDYIGEITNVSYSGSSSGGSTAYQITAAMEYVEGIYPGMSVSAEIVIESSGEGLLVPADAVYTSGDSNYIYLAPADAVTGQEYEEDVLDTDKLTKVYVTVKKSDGSYILIENDELEEGELIIVAKLAATQTGSSNESNQGGMGGFGGAGGMGGGRPGGMDFGDFDFGSFDPGNMPSGGFPGMGG